MGTLELFCIILVFSKLLIQFILNLPTVVLLYEQRSQQCMCIHVCMQTCTIFKILTWPNNQVWYFANSPLPQSKDLM